MGDEGEMNGGRCLAEGFWHRHPPPQFRYGLSALAALPSPRGEGDLTEGAVWLDQKGFQVGSWVNLR